MGADQARCILFDRTGLIFREANRDPSVRHLEIPGRDRARAHLLINGGDLRDDRRCEPLDRVNAD